MGLPSTSYWCARTDSNRQPSYPKSRLNRFTVSHTVSQCLKKMAKHGGIAVDDSIGQVQKATGYSGSTISDVHRFLEWCGLEVRLKQGGGPKKQPTVRRLIPQIPREHLNGIISSLNEFYQDLDGETQDLNGAFPDTPRELPRYLPRVSTSKNSTHFFEEPFNEEDFIDEEFGVTPKDVLELLFNLERPDLADPF